MWNTEAPDPAILSEKDRITCLKETESNKDPQLRRGVMFLRWIEMGSLQARQSSLELPVVEGNIWERAGPSRLPVK